MAPGLSRSERPPAAPARDLSWIRLALSPHIVRRALAYGVVVGGVLVVINHGDALLRGEWTTARAWKIALTPFVPYVVSTLSSVSALRSADRRGPASADDPRTLTTGER